MAIGLISCGSKDSSTNNNKANTSYLQSEFTPISDMPASLEDSLTDNSIKTELNYTGFDYVIGTTCFIHEDKYERIHCDPSVMPILEFILDEHINCKVDAVIKPYGEYYELVNFKLKTQDNEYITFTSVDEFMQQMYEKKYVPRDGTYEEELEILESSFKMQRCIQQEDGSMLYTTDMYAKNPDGIILHFILPEKFASLEESVEIGKTYTVKYTAKYLDYTDTHIEMEYMIESIH